MSTQMVPLPARMARLPRDKHDRPVPWFVAWIDGQPDHRIMRPDALLHGIRHKLCWLCGQPLSAFKAFVVGPMCAINRICAVYAAQACPWLSTPAMHRRDTGKAELGVIKPGGVMIERNPGACLVWVTKTYRVMRVDNGLLILMGDPTQTLWYAEGRPATRTEVLASIESGLPIVREAAEQDGPDAVTELEQRTAEAMRLLPAGDGDIGGS